MTREELVQLYYKERKYQEKVFGDYKDNPAFNLATFITFIEKYIDRVKQSYCDRWILDLPPWLITCKEKEIQNTAPVEAYEDVVKIMALAGAVLETYAEIDIEEWRKGGEINPKWEE